MKGWQNLPKARQTPSGKYLDKIWHKNGNKEIKLMTFSIWEKIKTGKVIKFVERHLTSSIFLN